MPGTGICREVWHFPSKGRLSARHILAAYLETAEEAENTVGGTVAPWFSINGIDLSQDFFLQRKIGVEIDLGGFYRFMPQPQCNHGSIDTRLE